MLDTLIVIVLRLRAGRSPFAADRQHFHHRLLALDHYEAVVVIYAVQCLLLLLAWQLRFENDLLIVATFLGFAVLFTGSFLLLERAGCVFRVGCVRARFRVRRHGYCDTGVHVLRDPDFREPRVLHDPRSCSRAGRISRPTLSAGATGPRAGG